MIGKECAESGLIFLECERDEVLYDSACESDGQDRHQEAKSSDELTIRVFSDRSVHVVYPAFYALRP